MQPSANSHSKRRAPARARWRGWPALAVLLAALGLTHPAQGQLPDAATHRLGPGDVLAVQLYSGTAPEPLTVQVDDAGQIVLPLVNSVNVGGLTPRQAEELLTTDYAEFYVKPAVSILVQSYGQIEIFVFGPDFAGRIVKLPNGARLLDLLSSNALTADSLQLPNPTVNPSMPAAPDAASAPASTAATGKSLLDPPGVADSLPVLPPFLASGTYRRLNLIRGGGAFEAAQPPTGAPAGPPPTASPLSTDVRMEQPADARVSLERSINWRSWIAARRADPDCSVWEVDPLKLTLGGQLSQYNYVLHDKDVLFVPVPERFVEVQGVAQPGRYELLDEETLGDLLRLTGSPQYDSDLANAVVQRYDSVGHLSRIILNLVPGLDDVSQIASFKLANRDRIGIFPAERRVFVLGEVQEAGAFPFVEDSTVLDYIAEAKGDTAEANLAWIAVIRQSRDRLNPGAPAQVITVNFKQIHAGEPTCADFNLEPGDVVYVPPKGKDLSATELLQSVGAVINGFAVARSLRK
jgi:protein involved in polysaccharide export with SLBB domain